MAYTCNVRGLEEVEKMGRKFMYFKSLIKIIRVMQLSQNFPESLRSLVTSKPRTYGI